MKNSFIPLILIVFSLFLNACSQSAEDKLAGEWKLVDIKSNQFISDVEKEAFTKAMEELKASTKYSFKKDLTYESTNSGIATKGTWKISEDIKTLEVTDESGSKIVINIKELTESTLVLEEEEDGVVTTLVFNK